MFTNRNHRIARNVVPTLRLLAVLTILTSITATSARAQAMYSAVLRPLTPTPENVGLLVRSEFTLFGNNANFRVFLDRDIYIPMSANLAANDLLFPFDLGIATITLPTPGGPGGEPGDLGSTSFTGSFSVPEQFQQGFSRGDLDMVLAFQEGPFGVFQGRIVPIPEPSALALVGTCLITFAIVAARRRKARVQ